MQYIFTTIQIVQQPEETTIIGYEAEDDQVQLTTTLDGCPIYSLDKAKIVTLFKLEEDDDIPDFLARSVPFACEIIVKDTMITEISLT